MHYTRFHINRLLGRETVLDGKLGGTSFRLAVTARREIRRMRELSHETALIEQMQAHLREGDTIYDVGANIGLISLLLALHPTGSRSRIHCFEPEPRNFARLCRNIEINSLSSRVSPQQLALGAAAGDVELFVRGTAGEGRHSIATDRGSTGSIRVPLATATDFADSCDALPDIVKIDVEGAEGQVLSGMERLLRQQKPRELFMEIHPKGDGDQMPDGTLIDDWLTGLGYTLAWNNQRRSGQHRHYRAPGPVTEQTKKAAT